MPSPEELDPERFSPEIINGDEEEIVEHVPEGSHSSLLPAVQEKEE